MIEWALLILPGLIWGASFLFIAEGLDALEPDGISFARFLIGFVCLSFVRRARAPITSGDGWRIAGLGLVWFALPMSLFPHAELRVTSALTGMLNGAVPLLTVAISALMCRRLPPMLVRWGLVVGLCGTCLVALPGLSAGKNSADGVLLILLALCCYGLGINLARPLQQRNGALPVVWRGLAVATLLLAPFGAPALLHPRWSWHSGMSVLALGVLGTAAANVLMTVASGRLGASRASATIFLIPVVALALGVLVRGEHVSGLAVCGCALCLAGAGLVRRGAV